MLWNTLAETSKTQHSQTPQQRHILTEHCTTTTYQHLESSEQRITLADAALVWSNTVFGMFGFMFVWLLSDLLRLQKLTHTKNRAVKGKGNFKFDAIYLPHTGLKQFDGSKLVRPSSLRYKFKNRVQKAATDLKVSVSSHWLQGYSLLDDCQALLVFLNHLAAPLPSHGSVTGVERFENRIQVETRGVTNH